MGFDAQRSSDARGLRRREGTIILLTVIAMLGMMGVAALVLDGGHVWAARTELQMVADSAALAGANDLYDPEADSMTLNEAKVTAFEYGLANQADQVSIEILDQDLTFGSWNFATSSLDSVDPMDPNQVNAVRVVARLDDEANGPVQTLFTRVFGRQSVDVTASAIGYLGYAGSFPPGTVDLPIAFDCCAITAPNSDCNSGFNCSQLMANPINSCPLADGTPATCIELNPEREQNACWTDFGSDADVDTPDLIDIVESSNSFEVEGKVTVDSGYKIPTGREIYDRFYGEGDYFKNPSGEDRYPDFDGVSDSWVVAFPVVECQDENRCSSSSPQQVVGAVCYEIREIKVAPNPGEAPLIIKGNFVCDPSDPLFKDCRIDGAKPGGMNFHIRAEHAVLVQ